MISKKILIIGLPNAGKTCITKTFFEGVDPKKLLSSEGSPEPTLGVQNYISSWIDTQIGIIDSSGQEFQKFIEGNNYDQEIIFGNADIIIYVFDINNWLKEKNIVIRNLKKILEIKDKLAIDAEIFSFCHKIDLLKSEKNQKTSLFTEIEYEIQSQHGIKTIFTSIEPEFIHSLFYSMQIILNKLSKRGTSLESFLKEILLKIKSSALVLLDEEYKLISDRRSEDISVVSLYNFINFIKLLNSSLQKIENSDFFKDGIFHSKKGMNIMMKSLEKNEYGIKYVIMVSQNANMKTLEKIIDFIMIS